MTWQPRTEMQAGKLDRSLHFQESSKAKLDSSTILPTWRKSAQSVEKVRIGMTFSLFSAPFLSAGTFLFPRLVCIRMLAWRRTDFGRLCFQWVPREDFFSLISSIWRISSSLLSQLFSTAHNQTAISAESPQLRERTSLPTPTCCQGWQWWSTSLCLKHPHCTVLVFGYLFVCLFHFYFYF